VGVEDSDRREFHNVMAAAGRKIMVLDLDGLGALKGSKVGNGCSAK